MTANADVSNASYKYTFEGVIYPLEFKLPPIAQHVYQTWASDSDNNVLTVELREGNLFVGTVDSSIKWELGPLVNHLALMLQTILDALSFWTPFACQVFIRKVARTDGEGYVHRMDHDMAIAAGAQPDYLDRTFTLVNLIGDQRSHGFGWHLTRALSEFRAARQNELDSATHCFRAIECLRVYCRDTYNIGPKDKPMQWAKVRELSGMTQPQIAKLQAAAEAGRHGDFRGTSAEDVMEYLTLTGRILHTFFLSIFNGTPPAQR